MARLTVRHESAIGQLLSCPKCGSMIQVEAPEGWTAESVAAARASAKSVGTRKRRRKPVDPNDSQATLSNDFGEIESILSDEPTSDSAASAESKTAVQVSPKIHSQKPGSPRTASPPVQPSADGPVLPDDQWTSTETKRRRKAFAWVTGILAVCFIALALIAYMVTRMFGGVETASKSVDEDAASKTAVADLNSQKNLADNNQSSADDATAKETDIGENAGVGDAPSDSSESKKTEMVEGSGHDKETTGAAEETPIQPPDSKKEAPTSDQPFEVDDEKPAAGANTTGQNDASMIDQFGNISDILFDPGVDVNKIHDPSTDAATRPIGIGKVFVPKPEPLNIAVSEQLTEVFPAVQFQEISLIHFARFFNALTSIPIQIDSQSVLDGRIDPQMKVGVDQSGVTAEALLRLVLEPVKLTYQITNEDKVIVITCQDADAVSREEYAIDPAIARDKELVSKLIPLIIFFVDPPSWTVNGGNGLIEESENRLIVDQTMENHRRVSRFLELLAAAATLKQNPGDAQATQRITSLYRRNANIGQNQSAFELLHSEPISDVLNQIERVDGVTVLVDWSSLVPMGWHPHIEIPWPSKDQDLASTLHDVATSMGLVNRWLSDDTCEITTRWKYLHSTHLEIYPCDELLKNDYTGDQIIIILASRIEAAIPPGAHWPVQFEPHTSSIVAILTQPLHVRLERILEELADLREASR